ncbi:iron complex transport system substrate-binding protein [Pseudonocardia ammonioxydans]|uniref:Iron complex transport system substrate-binding protein n=1 Tax=Pseudonocardia ammonioxydans TaxID=260086 RepID=A0A1I4SAL6_PSUAM|nr:ABC transporter substrate-binding protein [Pseudonocardia ammonioxydans]SFM61512.1 iron complex transport system substrate-binding protein [Pseudonocardia ammonioxydans]
MSLPIERRTLLRAAGGLGLAALLAGCAGGGGSGADDGSGAGARTIAHKFGSTEVSGTPARVVTLGLTDQDYAIALGTVPVGVREWFGGHPGALWPWAQERAGGTVPEVLPVEEIDFEQIARLAPDVVLAPSGGLTQADYDQLSRIAPTVAQPGEFADYGAPWQKIMEMTGAALGQPERAAELTREVEGQFAATRAEHPEFAGKTALLATVLEDGSYYLYAEGPAPRFLVDLGLTMPPAAEAIFTGPERAPQMLSRERLSLLEADLLLVGLYGDQAQQRFTTDPVAQGLRVVEEGRTVLMPELSTLNGTLSFGSVLSLPKALEEAVPRFTAALDGDPATPVPAAG